MNESKCLRWQALENAIDQYEEDLEPLANFILPTGSPLAASLHVARTVCRRAERRVVTLAGRLETTVPANAIEYLNRLGDLLFVLARTVNKQAHVVDDPWHPSMTKSVASNESGRILRQSVEDATSLLKEVAEDIRVQHAAGEDGLSLCRLRTKAVDRSVREIWDAILEELPESDRLEVGKRVTVVAHGGYARGEMTPGLMWTHVVAR